MCVCVVNLAKSPEAQRTSNLPVCMVQAYVMRYGRLKDFWVSSLGFRVLGGFKVVLGECYGKPVDGASRCDPEPQTQSLNPKPNKSVATRVGLRFGV